MKTNGEQATSVVTAPAISVTSQRGQLGRDHLQRQPRAVERRVRRGPAGHHHGEGARRRPAPGSPRRPESSSASGFCSTNGGGRPHDPRRRSRPGNARGTCRRPSRGRSKPAARSGTAPCRTGRRAWPGCRSRRTPRCARSPAPTLLGAGPARSSVAIGQKSAVPWMPVGQDRGERGQHDHGPGDEHQEHPGRADDRELGEPLEARDGQRDHDRAHAPAPRARTGCPPGYQPVCGGMPNGMRTAEADTVIIAPARMQYRTALSTL